MGGAPAVEVTAPSGVEAHAAAGLYYFRKLQIVLHRSESDLVDGDGNFILQPTERDAVALLAALTAH